MISRMQGQRFGPITLREHVYKGRYSFFVMKLIKKYSLKAYHSCQMQNLNS